MSELRPPARLKSAAFRKAKSAAFTGLLWLTGVIAMVPLVLIIGYVLIKGTPVMSGAFFTQTAPPPGMPGGGMAQAFMGTGLIVGIGTAFSVPLGVLTAVYLSEYGRGRLATVVRFVAEILLSTPSIVAGAFIWAVVVTTMHSFSAIAGSIALTVLMWPIITRATEETLRLVPNDLREAALALGVPRWKMVLRIVIPTAGSGILTAVMLAVARGFGETAPILLTSLGNDFINTNPLQPTDAVPLRIYNYAQSAFTQWQSLAWGGAVSLLAAVLVLSRPRIAGHGPAQEVAQRESLVVVHGANHNFGTRGAFLDGGLDGGQIRPLGDRHHDLDTQRAVHLLDGAEKTELTQWTHQLGLDDGGQNTSQLGVERHGIPSVGAS